MSQDAVVWATLLYLVHVEYVKNGFSNFKKLYFQVNNNVYTTMLLFRTDI